jgi:hypothetical protein
MLSIGFSRERRATYEADHVVPINGENEDPSALAVL